MQQYFNSKIVKIYNHKEERAYNDPGEYCGFLNLVLKIIRAVFLFVLFFFILFFFCFCFFFALFQKATRSRQKQQIL